MGNRQNVVPTYRRHSGSSRRMLSPMRSCEPIYITIRSCRWLFFFTAAEESVSPLTPTKMPSLTMPHLFTLVREKLKNTTTTKT